jgi:hypothetical protein
MTDFMQHCLELALAEDVRVEEWSDGTFSTAFEVAAGTWRIHYRYDNGWIVLHCNLMRLTQPDEVLLRRLLSENVGLLVMRYAVHEKTVCVRGEISEQELNDDEFRLVSRTAIDAVKYAIESLGLTAPVEPQ